jgi:ribosomal protein L37AE/L43A
VKNLNIFDIIISITDYIQTDESEMEKKQEVRTFQVNYYCDKCNKTKLIYKVTNRDELHIHSCKKCDLNYKLDRKYPYIEIKDKL